MRTLICLLFILYSHCIISQNVAINEDGTSADPSAMLDIQSNNKGILIPRMNSIQRLAIANPANGLLVFDSNSQSFWFSNGSDWEELSGTSDLVEDEDMDTRIEVEEQVDEDRIRMYIADEEALMIEENANGAHRFETYASSRNLFVGHEAGLNSSQGHNTFLGYRAGLTNLGGSENVFIGHESGAANLVGDDNVFLGYQAGNANIGSFNVFLGSRAGYENTSGDDNTFLGYHAGDNNATGNSGTFVGHNAGGANTTGSDNTFIGQGAAFYNSTGEDNTFVGADAGRRNRSGNRNTALGKEAMGPNLTSGNHGDDNLALGFQAGFYLNETADRNILLGTQTGFNQTVGIGNILMGYQTGYPLNNAYYNVGIGHHVFRNSSTGDRNVAIGDSAMIASTGSDNIAIGTFSGENLTGSSNVLLGRSAGQKLATSGSVFIGQFAGEATESGQYNSFIGSLSGQANSRGNYNSFLGHSAGDRNTIGEENAYVGAFAGHGNTEGDSNTAFGFNSLFANNAGDGNVAIGRDALANLALVNEGLTQSENTALGFQSGHIDRGNYNTTLGARTRAGNNDYNLILGYEATSGGGQVPDGTRTIAVGYQTRAGSENTIAIGRNTTVGRNDNIILGANGSDGFVATNAVGIGNDILLASPNTIILGSHSDSTIATGIGTNNPTAKLQISNTNTTYQRPLSVEQDGQEAFEVWFNRGIAVGDPSGFPPFRGLQVYGQSEFGQSIDVDGNADIHGDAVIDDLLFINTTVMPTDYQVAIDGRVACTELRVQAVNDWPDYVFANDYDLMDLKKVKSYIDKYKHLPGVPSAKEVEEAGGVEVGNTQKILLKKIEELTLYILQLEQRMELLENQK